MYYYQVIAMQDSSDGPGESAGSNVANAPTGPKMTVSPDNLPVYPITEGSPVTLSFAYAPGEVVPATHWTVDWGDGSTVTAYGVPTSFTHAYAAPGTYTFNVSTADRLRSRLHRGRAGEARRAEHKHHQRRRPVLSDA